MVIKFDQSFRTYMKKGQNKGMPVKTNKTVHKNSVLAILDVLLRGVVSDS